MQHSSARRRLRYSLRAFFIVTTIACFAFYHWHVASRLRSAEAELRKLRSETCRITVDDETMVHVVAIDTGTPNTWRWRMFIPQGHRYTWNVASKDIPFGEPPARAGRSGASNMRYWERDNEVLVNAQLQKNANGEWSFGVQSKIGESPHQMAGVTMAVPNDHLEWLDDGPSVQFDILGKKAIAVVDPSATIILLVKRPMQRLPNGDTDFHKDPSPGLMVWLKPK